MRGLSVARVAGTASGLIAGAAVVLALPLSAAPAGEAGREEAGAAEVRVGDWTGHGPADELGPGAAIYRESCAGCHEAGTDRAPQRMNLANMTPEAIHRALADGAMREQGAALSADQKLAVAEYLSGRTFGSHALAATNVCKGQSARFDMREPPVFSGWGLDPAGTHSIPPAVAGLSKAKVGKLKLKWAFGFPASSRARSRPALAGGAIFVGNHNGTVYALDRMSGCLRWAFAAEAEVRTGIVVTPWRAGDLSARPLVHFGDTAGNVYAVGMTSGALAWKLNAPSFQQLRRHPAVAGVQLETRPVELKEDRRWKKRG